MSDETILVVDDSQHIADFLADELLPELGYQTLVARDGSRALQLAKSHQPDLVLLDFHLPDITGLTVLDQLVSDGYHIPAILITGEGSEQIAVDAFRLGVEDYLVKPVDADALGTAITRALTETRLRREKAKLTAQLKQQVSWLTALSKVGQIVTSTLELGEVLRRVVEAGVYLTQAEEGFLALLDDHRDQLYLRAVKNMDQERSETLRSQVSDSLLGRVLTTGRPVRLGQPSPGQPLKVSTGYLVHSLLHVPVLSKEKVLGVLSVANRSTRQAFTETHEILLSSVADYAAVAIENAGLYLQTQQEITERKRAEAQIAASLREKEVLLKEIHHRVKNNLQVIYSLLNLQASRIEDQQALKVLWDSQNRVRSMALIHEKLYRSDDLARIDLADYIQELANFLFGSYGNRAETIDLNIHSVPVSLGIDKAVTCGLILSELISNALKHAFPSAKDRPPGGDGGDGRKAEICLELQEVENHQLTLTIADNGIGLPSDLDALMTNSLGLQLVTVLVGQLDGTLAMHSDGGAQFEITFAAP